MEECFKNAVQQLGQIATDAQTTSGRVIRVEEGSLLPQTRIRVIDGFDTPNENTIAEAISDDRAAKAVTDALAIQFGVSDIYEGGTFDEQKNTVRYAAPGASEDTLREVPPSPPLQVRRRDSLLPPVDQLRLKAEDMEATEGRVIQIEQGGILDQKRRIRVIDDFGTGYQIVAANVVCTAKLTDAITSTMQIAYGVERVVRGGKFLEAKSGLRYQIPKSYQAQTSSNVVSEDTTPLRGR